MKKYEMVLEYLKSQKVFSKHLSKHYEYSGSSKFAPIGVWQDEITCKMDIYKNVFKKLIERTKKQFPFIKYGYFTDNEGSCSPELVFKFKTDI